MLALAHHRGIEGGLEPAIALMRTCYQMYESWPTGLAPEITFMRNKGPDGTVKPNVPGEGNADMRVKAADSFSLLRPEALESLFVMYRVTRNETCARAAFPSKRAASRLPADAVDGLESP